MSADVRCEHCGLPESEDSPLYRFHEDTDSILSVGKQYVLHENCKNVFSDIRNIDLVGFFNFSHADLLKNQWV